MHDMHYVPAKQTSFSSVPLTEPQDEWEEKAESASALGGPTHHRVVVKKHRKDPDHLGNVYFKDSEHPDEESLVFAIRKQNRGYTAETPIMAPIKAGKKTITPHFALGVHKDHKAMAGFVFRMPF
ncbi:MAG: hypothetical protein ACPG80_02865 [Rickettsiales bacterium]